MSVDMGATEDAHHGDPALPWGHRVCFANPS